MSGLIKRSYIENMEYLELLKLTGWSSCLQYLGSDRMVSKLTVNLFFKGTRYNYTVSFKCSDLLSCGYKLMLVKILAVQ